MPKSAPSSFRNKDRAKAALRNAKTTPASSLPAAFTGAKIAASRLSRSPFAVDERFGDHSLIDEPQEIASPRGNWQKLAQLGMIYSGGSSPDAEHTPAILR